MGCSPWGHKELDTTEHMYACTHISLYSANTIVLNLIGLFIVGLKKKKKPAN